MNRWPQLGNNAPTDSDDTDNRHQVPRTPRSSLGFAVALQVDEPSPTPHGADMAQGDDDLDRLAAGVALLDARGRVVRLNRAAIAIVQANDGLMLIDDLLRALSLERTMQLQDLIDGTVQVGLHAGPGGTLQIERPSGRPPWIVLVLPLIRQRSPQWHPDAVAAIFISESRDPGSGSVAE